MVATAWVFAIANVDSNLSSSAVFDTPAFFGRVCLGMAQCGVLGGRLDAADCWFNRNLSVIAFL